MFGFITKPIIKKIMGNIMDVLKKDILPQILEFLKSGIDKWGTKFMLAVLTECGIFYLAYTGKIEGWQALIGMVVVWLGYAVARRNQETNQDKKKKHFEEKGQ